MNAKLTGWSRRYQKRLLKYIKQKQPADLRPALKLGTQAVTLGLETLDLALLHAQVLVALLPTVGKVKTRQNTIHRAKVFFAEAVVPIEKTHQAALQTGLRVDQLLQTLRQRTSESAASSRSLQQGIDRRQKAELDLKKSGEDRFHLLWESRRLQTRLLHQTRKILAAQENARQKASRRLHEDIAQSLLAIHLRLLTLKTSAQSNTESLTKEIANTQRMVGEFTRKVKTAHS